MEIDGRIPNGQLEQMQHVVDAQLSAAWSRTDVFERRATTVLGVIGVVLTILFSVLSLVDLTTLSVWAKASATAAVAVLLVSGGFCLNVLKPRDVQAVANERLTDLWNKQQENPEHETLQIQAQVLNDIVLPEAGKPSVLVSATKEAEDRAVSLLWAMRVFAVGVLLLGITIMLVLWVKIAP